MNKYLVSGTLMYDGRIEIEADSASDAVELFNEMTPDDLVRSGDLFGNDSEIDDVLVLKDDKWFVSGEQY